MPLFFKEDIQMLGHNSENCVRKEINKDSNHTEDGVKFRNNRIFKHIPDYSNEDLYNLVDNEDNNPTSDGCFLRETSRVNIDTNIAKCKNSTGIIFEVPEGASLDSSYIEVCHREELLTITPFIRFFKLLFVSILIILLCGIIGSCYEFWLEYGRDNPCIWYNTPCTVVKKTILDYLLPNDLCEYPYNIDPISRGGGGSNSRNSEATSGIFTSFDGEKTCNVSFDDKLINYISCNSKPLPYNIADMIEKRKVNNAETIWEANKEAFAGTLREVIRNWFRRISFSFLFSIYVTRYYIEKIIYYSSVAWSSATKSNQPDKKIHDLTRNLGFLVLSGIFFLLFKTDNIYGQSILNLGPMFFLTFIIIISSAISIWGMLCGLVFYTQDEKLSDNNEKTSRFLINRESFSNYIKQIKGCNNYIENYYYIENFFMFMWNRLGNLYQIYEKHHDLPIQGNPPLKIEKLWHWCKVWCCFIFWCLPWFLLLWALDIFLFFFTWPAMTLIASIYFTINFTFKFFQVPLSNYTMLLKILKRHSELLSILLCMGVIAYSSSNQILPKETLSIMSIILACIILKKIFNYVKDIIT